MNINTVDCDPDEKADLESLIAELIDKPDEWMDTPNDQLSGEKPRDLIGTNREERVRELLRAIKIGIPA
jgi:hypothetical protein